MSQPTQIYNHQKFQPQGTVASSKPPRTKATWVKYTFLLGNDDRRIVVAQGGEHLVQSLDSSYLTILIYPDVFSSAVCHQSPLSRVANVPKHLPPPGHCGPWHWQPTLKPFQQKIPEGDVRKNRCRAINIAINPLHQISLFWSHFHHFPSFVESTRDTPFLSAANSMVFSPNLPPPEWRVLWQCVQRAWPPDCSENNPWVFDALHHV